MERASDVHIDPSEDEYLVRFRVDGVLRAGGLPTDGAGGANWPAPPAGPN